MAQWLFVLIGIISLGLGLIVGYFVRLFLARQQLHSAEAKIEKILASANNEAREIILNAQDKSASLHETAKKEIREREVHLTKLEERVVQNQERLHEKIADYEKKEASLRDEVERVKKIKGDVEALKEKEMRELERIAHLTLEDAKNAIIAKVETEEKETLMGRIRKVLAENQNELERKAKELLATVMQRMVSSQVSEVTTTSITLPSDELKGKIIGKEGRNIKTLEKLTGVEIIVDETPGEIMLSCFDPVRRHIARIALEKLILDGRIQPARIEEVVEKAREEIDREIQKAGEKALYEIGVSGLDPKLVYLLGRLRFRTSFGQNVLQHSLEMAYISSMLAEELKGDVRVARMGALFHDIGKAVDHEIQGTHVEIGRKILQKFGIDNRIIQAMQSHHEEYPFETLESVIVQIADACSGGRPGARRGTVENYIKRLEDLEKIASSFEGVEKSYAISAGRELRIFVKPGEIDDYKAILLAKSIAQKIESELKYPGEIKVNVIRETRTIEYAR